MLSRAPIRLRLTLWYVLLLALVLAAFSSGVYLWMRHTLYSNFDDSIRNQASALLDGVQYAGDRPTLPRPPSSNVDDQDDRYVRVFDASGEESFDGIHAPGHIPVDAGAVATALLGDITTRTVESAAYDDPMRVISVPIIRDGAVVGVLEVGQSQDDVSDTLGSLLLIMGIAYPVTLIVAGFGGVFLAGFALSPIGRITRTARQISAEDLSRRLDLELPDDEVGRLAKTFDDMIARLDDAFGRQRRFTADASHELRTPLTIIKGQIEVSLQQEREPEAYRRVLEAVNEEVDRVIRLAGSLLTLTRADAGQIPLVLEAVDISELLGGVVEQVEPTAADRGVEIRLDPGPPIKIMADEDLVLQLMLNLLDNAIKYTPRNGCVRVGWELNGGHLELKVKDTGIGIPGEHLPYLFDRFYRVNTARGRSDGGVGLGLAISRWIAEAHGGSIRVESEPGTGSTFTAVLPAAG